MTKYTIFCRETSGSGTTHIDSHEADAPEEAAALGIAQCRSDWGWEDPELDDQVEVVGIAAVVNGEIEIIEWND